MIDNCFPNDKSRLRHNETIEILRSRLAPITSTTILDLREATGRVLAQTLIAPRDIPAFDNSAVDGYAFSHESYLETGGVLPLKGRIAAGDRQATPLPAAHCAQIFTGARMPAGADSVAMQEGCQINDRDGIKSVAIPPGLPKGANARMAGEDVKAGDDVVVRGEMLRPQDIAAIASCGISRVKVREILKLALASTGNEIVRPGRQLATDGVYDANYFMICSLLDSLPVEITDLGVLKDNRETMEKTLLQASGTHSLVIVNGGASLGGEDHVSQLLADRGKRHIWQLAIKPGRPMCFGELNGTAFFGLPGNPVASFVCFLLYVRPSIIALSGGDWHEPRRYKIPAGFDLKNKKPGRREYWRGFIIGEDREKTCLAKYGRDGSGLVSGLQKAQGLIEVDEDVTRIARGDPLNFIPFAEFGIL